EVLIGTLQIGNSDLGGTFTAAAGTVLRFSGTYNVPAPPATSGAGTVNLTGSIHFTAPLSGSYTLNGGILFGTNTVSGLLNWSGGTVRDQLTVVLGGVLNMTGSVTKTF